MFFHPIYLSSSTWMWIVGIYIAIASIAPVWILLQPRDYLSSFLLYAMLSLNGYGKIWALFGSANQLLAVATWLGRVGKDNKMFLIPMAFMLCVTIASLYINTTTRIGLITAGGADWGPWAQAILGILLIFLAVVLAIGGIITIVNQKKNKVKA